MIIQDRDGSLAKESGHRPRAPIERAGYYAAVSVQALDGENGVLDDLISFAFDTLGARHLELRVYDDATVRSD